MLKHITKFSVQITSILLLVCFFQSTALAVPSKEILEIFNKRFLALSTPEAFKEYISKNPEQFPVVNKENPLHTVSLAETIEVDKETFTLMVGYRSAFIQTKKNPNKVNFLKDLWSTPDLFQRLYFLDGSSKIEGNFTKDDFKARVFKKVEGIENQDYTLHYVTTHAGPWTFIRASLDKDVTEFGLRDNLKTLEDTSEGMIIREISFFYPLRWYVRALGPTSRAMMKKEIHKVSFIEKCLTEKSDSFPPAEEILKECAKQTKAL